MQCIYIAGGCLWGVQAFIKTLPGVITTEAGRANGLGKTLGGDYDGYAECVKTIFDERKLSVSQLMAYFFEIIDPYAVNKQGMDEGLKYRTGIYSEDAEHLIQAQCFIDNRSDKAKIAVEVKPLINYVKSAQEHQDRLTRCPEDYCHIPSSLLTKYVQKS